MGLISRMAVAKFTALTTRKTVPVRTPAPSRLTQGSSVVISQVPLVLAQAGGALFPADTFKASQSVVAIGRYEMAGFTVYRAYLSDGTSFIEAPVQYRMPLDRPAFLRLYTLNEEFFPSSPDQQNFFIGADPRYETVIVQGMPTPFNPTGQMQEQRLVADRVPALIGWPLFERGPDGAKVTFERTWAGGEQAVDPVVVWETVTDADGTINTVTHRMMQYQRSVGGVTEHLYADYAETAQGNVVDVHLGLELAASTVTILTAA